MLGGEDVVLGVNDVEAQGAELLHLHRLPHDLPGLQEVPERSNKTETAQLKLERTEIKKTAKTRLVMTTSILMTS